MLTDEAEVIPEAATDVNEKMLAEGISRPELDIVFLPRIVSLQRQRRPGAGGKLQVHDRSVYCTLALARFLGMAEPTELRVVIPHIGHLLPARALERIAKGLFPMH